jgi:hypothetical protein
MITQQQALEAFQYRDGELYWKVPKSIRIKVGEKIDGLDCHGYKRVRFNGRLYRVHRIIFLMHYGYMPKYIDHVNGNRADNRLENLREANAVENACNRAMQSNNSTKVKGVIWRKNIKHYEVSVQVNKIKHYCGIYKDLELAELVAVMAREKYHKQFARL